jgi:DNA-binding response OmpR family regulator
MERSSRRVVLVVDDHAPMRTLCRVALEAAGFEVAEAEDGEKALEAVRAQRPDAILLDIMMPRVSGWDVASSLLADRSTDKIPLIFITALATVPDRLRAFELGARAYLTKPFDPSVIPDTVSRVLDQIERGERDPDLAETIANLRMELERTRRAPA